MEAGRHETRRVAAVEKLSTATAAAERAGAQPGARRGGRPQQPAGPAHETCGPHGIAGRRPRGQAPRPEPLSRCAHGVRRGADRVRRRPARAALGQDHAQARRRHERRPARRLAVAPRRAGGPPSRDRPGDARRTGPEPDQHRAPGADRRTARGDRSGRCRRRGPSARGDGPADPRGDQVVHLRRSPDGPRRPRAGPDPSPRRQGARAASGYPRRIRLAGSRPTPADGSRERPVPDHRRGGGRLSQRASRPGLGPARLVRGGRGPCLGIAGDRRDEPGPDARREHGRRTCRRPLPR